MTTLPTLRTVYEVWVERRDGPGASDVREVKDHGREKDAEKGSYRDAAERAFFAAVRKHGPEPDVTEIILWASRMTESPDSKLRYPVGGGGPDLILRYTRHDP